MRSSIVIPTAVLTFALSMAPALRADDQDWRRDDRSGRYGQSDRYGRSDRYDRYDSRRVAALAHEMEETASGIYREAARNNRRPDRAEARMLSALRELSQEAHDFQRQVSYRSEGSRRTSREFDDLVDAYRETGRALDRVAPRPYVDRGMQRIGYLLSEVSGHYGRQGRYYDRDRRDDRGRYGRDRYDRRDRYGRDRDRDRDDWDDDRR